MVQPPFAVETRSHAGALRSHIPALERCPLVRPFARGFTTRSHQPLDRKRRTGRRPVGRDAAVAGRLRPTAAELLCLRVEEGRSRGIAPHRPECLPFQDRSWFCRRFVKSLATTKEPG